MTERASVLVVDDDPIVRKSCQRILEHDYRVRIAENGKQGLELLSTQRFDIALVDLMLPDLNGMEILRRASEDFPDVVIVIVTGYSTVKNAVESIKMGANDYIAKPFTPDELRSVVKRAVEERSLGREYHTPQDAR